MPEFLDKKFIPNHEDSFVGGWKGKQALLNNCGVLLSSAPIRTLTVSSLPEKVRRFVEESARLCCPSNIHICDGSEKENQMLLQKLQDSKTIVPLPKYKNCWLARTDPRDVARVESKTFISTPNMRDTKPVTKEGVKGQLANWMSPEDSERAIEQRFPNCMRDRTMYVIPFSMGPVGGALSKIGIQVTDSPYVVVSMRVMTRIGKEVLEQLTYAQESGSADSNLVTAMHSIGTGQTENQLPHWPCDPERTIILHMPEQNRIVSYGSGYGGNSLLGKKCFALRIGSTIARREGWLAEHMLIVGITPPNGEKKYIAAAFPSACGKTNLAMMLPTLPGYKIECVGDDIAWIRFDKKTGMLHAINPEAGIFGVAPGTSSKTNPNAMATVTANTVFTNVAMTSDGGVWWEGLPEPEKGVTITDWLGRAWNKDTAKTNAAHPNSRFCAPMSQCPIVDSHWEDSAGVPISAILFGGRRPEGVPLIYEAFDWSHGVFMGASMRSEATAAAEHKGKVIMHDPFAMRPFFGYNFGQYLEHWLSMENIPGVKLPKIFHVNWFRKDSAGKFMWPGFGDNIRVMDWVLKRIDGDASIMTKTPIGYVPKEDSIVIDDLKEKPNMKELLSAPKDFWLKEVSEINKYFEEQIPYDTPKKISEELSGLKMRLQKTE